MPKQRKAFQRELDAIDSKVVDLLSLIAPDVLRATHALLSGDHEELKLLDEHELRSLLRHEEAGCGTSSAI